MQTGGPTPTVCGLRTSKYYVERDGEAENIHEVDY